MQQPVRGVAAAANGEDGVDTLGVSGVLADEGHRLHLEAIERFDERSVRRSSVPTCGLALSGGGIRSATFALGVLQALAGRRYLGVFDFMSTVSGGGYIGSWLSAWIQRTSLAHVERALADSGTPGGGGSAPECAEVSWLRRYSNYLTPRLGLLSTDTLTLFATWLRNVSLNLLVIVAAVVVALLGAREMLKIVHGFADFYAAAGFLALACVTIAVCAIAVNLNRPPRRAPSASDWVYAPRGIVAFVLAPIVLASVLGAIWFAGVPPFTPRYVAQTALAVAVLFVVTFVLWIGLLVWTRLPRGAGGRRRWPPIIPAGERREFAGATWVYALAGLVGFGALFGLAHAIRAGVHRWPVDAVVLAHVAAGERAASSLEVAALVPPLLLFALSIGTTLFTGVVGLTYSESTREWWSRLNAWLMTAALAWLAWMALALYVPPAAAWAAAHAPDWAQALAGSAWIGALASALLGRVPRESSPRAQRLVGNVLNVSAWLVVAGFLVIVSVATDRALGRLADAPSPAPTAGATSPAVRVELSGTEGTSATIAWPPAKPPRWSDYVRAADQRYARELEAPAGFVAGDLLEAAFAAALAALALFGWRVDVNRFSIHNLYRLRLARCYLGASNQANRNPHPFTGFDESDDVPLVQLRESGSSVQRPLHIVNATLNLTQGRNLAWQERKAAGFVFTPFACGYALGTGQAPATPTGSVIPFEAHGYCNAMQYGSEEAHPGFSLSTALATSGAAVSPHQGYHSSPARAFLLTIFNLRLGRWSPNPTKRHVRSRSSPRFGLACLVQELFGFSNDERSFVYLSDGGHFDNTGLYELVRRRCGVIVLVDAAADRELRFRDLGDAIRKCRVDFGVDIELDLDKLCIRRAGREPVSHGFAVGRVRYDPANRGRDGTLIVVRPARTVALASDAADVATYAARNPDFPHQPTTDQFFDESQFESYRALGRVTGLAMLDACRHDLPDPVQLAVPQLKRATSRRKARRRRLAVLGGATLMTLAVLAGLAAFRALALAQPGMECARAALGLDLQATCTNAIGRLLEPDSELRHDATIVWLFADTLFAVTYASLLVFAARFAGSAIRGVVPRRGRRFVRRALIVVLVPLAVAAGALDAWENAALFGALTGQASAESALALTLLKYRVAITALGATGLASAIAWWRWRNWQRGARG